MTPESTSILKQLRDVLTETCNQAESAQKLQAENELLRQLNADAARLASQEATAKHYAEEHLTHLAKFLGLHGMTWSHVVSEAVSLIERQKQDAERFRQERDAARGATLATLPEAEVIAIQELKEDRRKLRAAIDKSCEALGNAMPECRGMSIHELVIEAAARINQATSFTATAPQVEMDVMIRELETLRQKANRNEERAMHLGVENIRLTGELGEAKADLDRAKRERDEARALVEKLIHENNALRGPVPPIKPRELAFDMAAQMIERLKGELLVAEDSRSSLMMDVDRLTAELAEARAENGRQAATIAAMQNESGPLEDLSLEFAIEAHEVTYGNNDRIYRNGIEVLPLGDDPPRPPIRIEVGKTYLRRDGGLETITHLVEERDRFGFDLVGDSGRCYDITGRHTNFPDELDLVALAPAIDPASPHP